MGLRRSARLNVLTLTTLSGSISGPLSSGVDSQKNLVDFEHWSDCSRVFDSATCVSPLEHPTKPVYQAMNSSKNSLAIPSIALSTPIFGLTDSDSEGTLKRPHEVRDGSDREVTAISNDWEASNAACASNNIFSRERTLRRARDHTNLSVLTLTAAML